jgi:hypothetical protein
MFMVPAVTVRDSSTSLGMTKYKWRTSKRFFKRWVQSDETPLFFNVSPSPQSSPKREDEEARTGPTPNNDILVPWLLFPVLVLFPLLLARGEG